jgi:carbonic anhydrase
MKTKKLSAVLALLALSIVGCGAQSKPASAPSAVASESVAPAAVTPTPTPTPATPASEPLFADITTKDEQAAMSPDQALAALKAGHDRFLTGKSRVDNFPAQVKATGSGQFPFATVLSCIDSRTAPEALFDVALGDIFAPRIAGNIVNEDILGSMEFASKVAGSKLVVVVGHTHCGAVKGACDNAKLGNLTTLLAKIRPAVDKTKSIGDDRSSKNSEFVDAAARTNVEMTVQNIRSKSKVLAEMETKGEIKIVGAMYNIENGELTFL